MQRKTGLLTLESDRETVTVVFEQGMVVHADSTVRRLDDLLGKRPRPPGEDSEGRSRRSALEAEGFHAAARLHPREPGLHQPRRPEGRALRAGAADRIPRLPLEVGPIPFRSDRRGRLRPRERPARVDRSHPHGRDSARRRMAHHREADSLSRFRVSPSGAGEADSRRGRSEGRRRARGGARKSGERRQRERERDVRSGDGADGVLHL